MTVDQGHPDSDFFDAYISFEYLFINDKLCQLRPAGVSVA